MTPKSSPIFGAQILGGLVVNNNDSNVTATPGNPVQVANSTPLDLLEESGGPIRVHYIRVEGTNRNIGEQLATIARQPPFKIGKLAAYVDAPFARARERYYKRNWPEMRARMQGVKKVFGTNGADDASALIYDVSPFARGPIVPSCTAFFLPQELCRDKRPMVARNYDAQLDPPSRTLGYPEADDHAEWVFQRNSVVLELAPTDGGHRVLALGCHDLLCPAVDALNDKGLYIATLADGSTRVSAHMAMAGSRNTGLSSRQVPLMLATRCKNVKEAKQELLSHNLRMDFGLHWLITDKSGACHGCRTARRGRLFRIHRRQGWGPSICQQLSAA
jgi:hypothetical protein